MRDLWLIYRPNCITEIGFKQELKESHTFYVILYKQITNVIQAPKSRTSYCFNCAVLLGLRRFCVGHANIHRASVSPIVLVIVPIGGIELVRSGHDRRHTLRHESCPESRHDGRMIGDEIDKHVLLGCCESSEGRRRRSRERCYDWSFMIGTVANVDPVAAFFSVERMKHQLNHLQKFVRKMSDVE